MGISFGLVFFFFCEEGEKRGPLDGQTYWGCGISRKSTWTWNKTSFFALQTYFDGEQVGLKRGKHLMGRCWSRGVRMLRTSSMEYDRLSLICADLWKIYALTSEGSQRYKPLFCT